MNPEKFAELQVQMKQNQQDYSDFLKDLDGWTSEMKNKDEQLKNQTPTASDKDKLPPVRNSLLKKKKKKTATSPAKENGDVKRAEPTKPQRISGYDFRAWDKFDVDKALEEVDGRKGTESGSSSSSSDVETDEEWEEERAKEMANVLKEQGNQYFKEGKYNEAINAYTRGIIKDGTNAILPANRAMALLKQGKYGAAEVDCSQSIVLDPTYVKAYARRGTARHLMGKLEEAKKDFQRVLSLEPANKQAQQDLDVIDKKLKSGLEVTEDSGIVKPIYKPPEKRSKKPLHRLKIEEIGEDEDERHKSIARTMAEQSQVKKNIIEQEEKAFQQFTESKVDEPQQKVSSEKARNLRLELEPSAASEASASPYSSVSSTSPASSRQSPASSSSSSPSHPCIPAAPLNSFQFQKDWQLLKDQPQAFHLYFKNISPDHYPKLFGQALESDMLLMVLNNLKQYYKSEDKLLYEVLVNLAKVKRFSMTVMFFSDKDKQVVRDVFSLLAEDLLGSNVAALRKQYQI